MAIKLLKEASDNDIFNATLELVYYYANKYILTKNSDYLNYLNTFIIKISTYKEYDSIYKKDIEKKLLDIKNKKIIDINILN